MHYKKTYINIILFSAILFSIGCTKILDTQSELFVENNAAIVDKRSANAALVGAYNALAANGNQGNTFRYIANLSSDNLRWVGNSPINREFWVHEVFATNTRILELWRSLYATINIANHVIEKVPVLQDVTYSQAERNRDRGEAFFIRAYNYFDLARLWGNVPLPIKATLSPQDAEGVGNTPQAEVYNQIQRDLDSAINLLPANALASRNRASVFAAKALKARLHLYRAEWQQAAALATEVIASENNFRLVRPYNQFYLQKNTTESIFEIAYTINNRNSYATNWFASNITGGTRELLPTNDLIAQLKDPNKGGDRSALLLTIGNVTYGNMNFKVATGDDQVFAIRLAEMYLIRAEARANLNDLTAGLADLNVIRQRANVPPIDAVTNTQDLVEKVLDERRLELAFESHRWFDLIRTGKAQQVLNISDAYRLKLPIPTQELLINDALRQNEGY